MKTIFLLIPLTACLLFAGPLSADGGAWHTLSDGFEIAWFSSADSAAGDSMFTIVRVNPQQHEIVYHSVVASDSGENLNVRQWCESEGLALAVNGGMYGEDFRTHIGLVQIDGEVISNHRNKYKSAMAWQPVQDDLPAFRLYDLDETSLDSLRGQYAHVVQNLRLIKRNRNNRWEPEKGRRWTEAALAEDSAGNALFILCRRPMKMHEFNERILALPLGIVAAQHLEGGVQTQMYIAVKDYSIGLSGGFESRMDGGTGGDFLFNLPHIIGVRLKTEAE